MKKLLLIFCLIGISLYGQVAKVVAFKGEAFIEQNGKSIPLTMDTQIDKDNSIITKENTKVQILFEDNTIITIGKNSTFKIIDYLFDEKEEKYNAKFGMIQGAFRTITGKIGKLAPDKFKLNSKSASIGIRGTQILSNIQVDGENIYCTEGEITVTSIETGQSYTLKAGEYISFNEDGTASEIKTFDVETIDDVDSDTKFKNEEEQKSALEKLGVTVEDTTPTNTDLVDDNTLDNIDNDDDTYDTLENTATSATSISGYIITGKHNNTYSSTLGYINISDGTTTMQFVKGVSGNELGFKLIMDDFQSKYNTGGAYSGNLSDSGSTMENPDGVLTLISGSYTSEKDYYSGGTLSYKDDDIQWGTWNFTTEQAGDTGPTSSGYWLIGNQTASSEVQALINSGTTATYNGFALGSSTAGTFDVSNTDVKLIFDFGGKSITSGSYIEIDSNRMTIEGSNTITSAGFSFSPTQSGVTGSGVGKFYGSNAASVGGSFNLMDANSDEQYLGVFKATQSVAEVLP